MKEYTVITRENLHWRESNIMKIPNADFLERTGSKMLGARLWRLPPMSAMTWHKHHTKEEFYFLLKGEGRMRVGEDILTIAVHEGIHVHPDSLRQVFNDTESESLWLIIGAPEDELEMGMENDPSIFYPEDPTRLPEPLSEVKWPS